MALDIRKVIVYGTLRYGHGNWQWALADAEVVRLADTVKGYSMRTHGGFPAVFEASPDSEIVVDVFDLSSLPDADRTLAEIDGMEFGCGYFRRLTLTETGEQAWMYIMPSAHADHYPTPVESGDWNTYCNLQGDY